MAEKQTEAANAATPAPAGGGGFKAWLPLIVTVVAMPALAFGTFQFLILPKMKQAAAASSTEAATEAESHEDESAASEAGEAKPASGGHGEAAATAAESGGHGGSAPVKKGKQTFTLNKMIVNVAGTSGTRYLCTSVTLVGTGSKFKDTIEGNRDQLLDLATSTLSSKTIADLEKPGARNQIKIELISVFNNVLGDSVIKEIYIPELAIQ